MLGTLATILADRFISTKAAMIALGLCLILLGWLHWGFLKPAYDFLRVRGIIRWLWATVSFGILATLIVTVFAHRFTGQSIFSSPFAQFPGGALAKPGAPRAHAPLYAERASSRQMLNDEAQQIVHKLALEYRKRHPDTPLNNQPMFDWINRNLKKRNLPICVSLTEADSFAIQGIFIEGGSDNLAENNTIIGSDQAITIENSPGTVVRNNKIYNPKLPQ
jgi:parallel beta-helix repeat protein